MLGLSKIFRYLLLNVQINYSLQLWVQFLATRRKNDDQVLEQPFYYKEVLNFGHLNTRTIAKQDKLSSFKWSQFQRTSPNFDWLQSWTILCKRKNQNLFLFTKWFSLVRTFWKPNLSFKVVGLFNGPDVEYPVQAKINHSNARLVPFQIHTVFVSLNCWLLHLHLSISIEFL